MYSVGSGLDSAIRLRCCGAYLTYSVSEGAGIRTPTYIVLLYDTVTLVTIWTLHIWTIVLGIFSRSYLLSVPEAC